VPYPEDVYIKQVQDEQFWLEEKKWEDGEEPYTEYDRTMPFGACTMYIEGSNDEDAGFHLGRLAEYTLSELGVVIRIFKRLDDLMYNNSCSNSSMLYTTDYSPYPYFLPCYFHDKQGQSTEEAEKYVVTNVPAFIYGVLPPTLGSAL